MSFQTKMYFSGSMNHPDVVDALMQANVHRLFTFASKKEAPEYLNNAEGRGLRCRVMCDSGAFTAWNIGRPVEVDQLIEYNLWLANKHPNHDFVFISLDVIPGERGRMPTESEIRQSVQQSFANFDMMQQQLSGHTVLPVYHSGEDRYVRDHYLSRTDWICLSMNQNLSERQRVQWASEAIVPGYRFHGLAATGNAMLSQVDWYSVDSSGWLMVAAMGAILFPIGNKLKPLAVSSTSPSTKAEGQHIDNMPNSRWIVKYIEEMGYSVESLRVDYSKRICWNIQQWLSPPWKRMVVNQPGLF